MTEDLVSELHSAGMFPLDAYFISDGTVRVDVGCSGCVLDAQMLEWAGADLSDGFVGGQGDADIELSTTDIVRFSRQEPQDRIRGWDIQVTLAVAGAAVVQRHAIFGRVTKQGFESATWLDFVRSLGAIEFVGQGSDRYVTLNSPTVTEVVIGATVDATDGGL